MSSVKPVRIHVPPKDGWPETVRGVGFRQACPVCDAMIRAPRVSVLRLRMREHRAQHAEPPGN